MDVDTLNEDQIAKLQKKLDKRSSELKTFNNGPLKEELKKLLPLAEKAQRDEVFETEITFKVRVVAEWEDGWYPTFTYNVGRQMYLYSDYTHDGRSAENKEIDFINSVGGDLKDKALKALASKTDTLEELYEKLKKLLPESKNDDEDVWDLYSKLQELEGE